MKKEMLLPIETRIRQGYATLSSAEKKLADIVLQNQAYLLNYSATELAEMAGTSKSSAARFFRRLGCKDFDDFREQIKEEQTKGSPLSRITKNKKNDQNEFSLHVSRDMTRLEAFSSSLSTETIDKTLNLINKAKNIWIVGYRHSHVTAKYLHALLSQIRPHIRLLQDSAGQDAEMISSIEPQDILIAIDFKRRSKRLKYIVPACHTLGAKIIIMSDTQASDLTAYAETVLCCSGNDVDESLFNSYVCAISLVNFLATEIAAKNKVATRKRLSVIEQMHTALSDLDTTV